MREILDKKESNVSGWQPQAWAEAYRDNSSETE